MFNFFMKILCKLRICDELHLYDGKGFTMIAYTRHSKGFTMIAYTRHGKCSCGKCL